MEAMQPTNVELLPSVDYSQVQSDDISRKRPQVQVLYRPPYHLSLSLPMQ